MGSSQAGPQTWEHSGPSVGSAPVTAPPAAAASLPTSGLARWVIGARVRTLPAAIAPVLVGTAAAATKDAAGRGLSIWRFGCALGVALFVQIATNYANDYSDGKRGTDDPTKRVGPPRLVGNGMATAAEVKVAMLICFGITLAFGTPLVLFVDWKLALVGVAAVAAGWFYTGGPRPYGYAGFGELFVFVFFGLVATIGSAYVQLERITLVAVGCGVAMGALATALLVVNNLRDIPGDTLSDKRTLAVRIGDMPTRWLYVGLLVVPFALVPFLAGASGRIAAALAIFAMPLALIPVRKTLAGARGPQLIPVLIGTARVQLVYGVLLAAGLLISA